jgi:ABC-type antimicrobial peptide transport system permease subunit
MNIVVKSRGEIAAAGRDALRETLRRIDPALPAASIRSMSTVIDGSMTWLTSFLRLLGVFAVIGLALAAIGVYGVLAYYVSQRSRELGVRVALGAPRRSIVSLVLRQSLWPVVAGIAAGLIGSYWSNQLISGSLFEVTPSDPVVMATIAAVLFAIGMAASWVPAARAARVDPIRALRED